MATTFSTAKVALDEIASGIQTNRKKLETVKVNAAAAEASLAAMPTTYGTIITDIEAAADNAPGDAALQALKGEKDKLVAEFTALKTSATAMKTATAAVAI